MTTPDDPFAGARGPSIAKLKKQKEEAKQRKENTESAQVAAEEAEILKLSLQATEKQASQNPRFDKRILNSVHPYQPGGGKRYRGAIVQSKAFVDTTGQKKPFRCNFLYNPSTISVAYTSSSVLPQALLEPAARTALTLIPNMQTISFALFFIRMFEVADIGDAGSKSAYSSGVYADVAALERVVGINRGIGGIQQIPCDLYFGTSAANATGSDRGNIRALEQKFRVGVPLAYHGRVDSMNVDYTHFSYNMTPVTAIVNIVFSQLVRVNGKYLENESVEPTEPTMEVLPP